MVYFRSISAKSDRCFLSSIFGSVQCNYPTVQNSVVCPRALAAMGIGRSISAGSKQIQAGREAKNQACPNDDSGLKLPAGFCATVFADDIGHVRHMVVAPSGVVYVNTWSGTYYGNDKPHAGGFLVALQDKSGDGKGRCD